MQKEIISDSQGFSMVTLFVMGSTLILGTAAEANRDKWISIIIGILMSIPMILIYSRIISLFNGKDLFDILIIIFGKLFGKLISLLYIWYFLHLGSLVMRNFGEFMNTLALTETPMLVPMLCIGVLCIWVSISGIEVLGRSSKLLLLTCIIVIIIIQFLTIPHLEFHHIKPILDEGWQTVFAGAFSAFSFPFAETVVFTGILYSMKKKKSSYKVLLSGLLFAGFFIWIIAFRNLFVLGPNILKTVYFPAYLAVSRVHIGEFIQRVEGSVAIVFVAGIFIKISVCLMAASNGISKVFELKSYRSVVIQTGLILSYLAHFIYDSIMEMQYFAVSIYKYYAIPFQIILPIVILITIEVKRRKHTLPVN